MKRKIVLLQTINWREHLAFKLITFITNAKLFSRSPEKKKIVFKQCTKSKMMILQ